MPGWARLSSALPLRPDNAASKETLLKLTGYSDPMSVRRGETINFMVSCALPSYRADIVRLIHGDPNPKGPGFKEELITTSVGGEYPGRVQDIRNGSYVVVEDSPVLRPRDGFTLQAWIFPTTPANGVQGIMTKWSASKENGFGLFVDENGCLALWLGDGPNKVLKVSSGRALRSSEWYFVAAVYDAAKGRVWLHQDPMLNRALEDSSAAVEASAEGFGAGESDDPLIIAAYSSGGSEVSGNFNGKIDGPRLWSRPLSFGEIESLRRDAPARSMSDGLAAAWDFSINASSQRAVDTSRHLLHGRVVNMPARAMTGHNWTGGAVDFKFAPAEYGAIHFHDDDLDDAGWDVDFSLKIPGDLRSGVYAARLTADGAEDYIPFFVRPTKRQPTARIAFLASTLCYVAYGNEHLELDETLAPLVPNADLSLHEEEYQYIVDNGLNGLYDSHRDGSGVCYATRLVPIPAIRPKFYTRGRGGTHCLAADLYLIDWMEAMGLGYDVITDEDLHFEGLDLLSSYNVVATGSHPEYWSGQMLDALESYLEEGGRLMYLGGNGFYWVTSFDPERPHIIEVRRWKGIRTWEAQPGEYYHSTTGEFGGLWRYRGRPPQKIAGVGFSAQGFDRSSAYRRQPGSFDPRAAFIFEGVGDDDLIGDHEALAMHYGAAGDEIDRFDRSLGTPAHALLLATSFGHSDVYHHVVEEIMMTDSSQHGLVNPYVRADIVYFETPNGGGVFSASSINWCSALSYDGYDNNVSRITGNVMRRFAADDPLG